MAKPYIAKDSQVNTLRETKAHGSGSGREQISILSRQRSQRRTFKDQSPKAPALQNVQCLQLPGLTTPALIFGDVDSSTRLSLFKFCHVKDIATLDPASQLNNVTRQSYHIFGFEVCVRYSQRFGCRSFCQLILFKRT